MRYLVNQLLNPLVLFWLIIGLALILRKRNKKWSTNLIAFGGIWLLLFTTPILPNLLVNQFEKEYPPLRQYTPNQGNKVTHILVLGGGHTSDPRLTSGNQLSEQSLARLMEGIRIHQMVPNSKLVFSGFSGEGFHNTHADIIAAASIDLGIAPKDTLKIETPKNTRQEAIDYKDRYGIEHALILVTSAMHMPRAMMHFEKAGLNPTAAPTNYLFKRDKLFSWWHIKPSSTNLKKIGRVFHESIGFLHGWYEWSLEETKKIQ